MSPLTGNTGQYPSAPVDKEMEARLVERKVRLSKIEVRSVCMDESSVFLIVILMDYDERVQSCYWNSLNGISM